MELARPDLTVTSTAGAINDGPRRQPDDSLRRELRSAADRLIAGTPLRSGGKLTISDLAAEAGIKRWILTHKRPDLMRQHQAQFKTFGQVPARLQAARDQIDALEADLAKARREKQHLADLVNTYAAIIHEFSDDLSEAERQRDQARAELDRHNATVSFIAPRQPRHDNEMFSCS
jgi:hypothetical protein